MQKLFDRGDVVVHDEGVDEAPHAVALAEASCHGFAEGPPAKLLGEGQKVFLAEAMLVKLPKMVAEPLMPKSLAKAMPT